MFKLVISVSAHALDFQKHLLLFYPQDSFRSLKQWKIAYHEEKIYKVDSWLVIQHLLIDVMCQAYIYGAFDAKNSEESLPSNGQK